MGEVATYIVNVYSISYTVYGIPNAIWVTLYDFCHEQFWWTQNISEKIHWWESESTDIHGVICETTKLATSDFGICDFVADENTSWSTYGSFSFKPTNSSDEVKCSHVVQTGFLNLTVRFCYCEPIFLIWIAVKIKCKKSLNFRAWRNPHDSVQILSLLICLSQ